MVGNMLQGGCSVVDQSAGAFLRSAGAPRARTILRAAVVLGVAGAGCGATVGGEQPVARLPLAVLAPTEPGSSSGVGAAAAEEGLDCGPVSACTDKCGAACPSGIRKLGCLMGCKSDCRAKGCSSAQKVFDELTDCIAKSCWTSCMDGPTPECRACSEKDCAAEAKQCAEHKCAR